MRSIRVLLEYSNIRILFFDRISGPPLNTAGVLKVLDFQSISCSIAEAAERDEDGVHVVRLFHQLA